MKVTADNYEQWALDYLEGLLTPSEKESFEHFLDSEPEIARQIRSLQAYLPVAQPEDISCPHTADLLRIRMSPWRRFLSMASGAAAAAVIAGGIMVLFPKSQNVRMAESQDMQLQPVEDIVVAESLSMDPSSDGSSGQAAFSDPAESHQDRGTEKDGVNAESLSESALETTETDTPSGSSSRLVAWNRKTSAWLKRMEERNDRRLAVSTETGAFASRETSEMQPTDRLAVLSETETETETETGIGTQISDMHSESILESEMPSGFLASDFSEGRSTGYSTLLPPDATTPILAMTEEDFMEDGFDGLEENVTAENAYASSESSGNEVYDSRFERKLLRTLLSPLEKISPIRYYETENARGIEIASILRIGSRNREP